MTSNDIFIEEAKEIVNDITLKVESKEFVYF